MRLPRPAIAAIAAAFLLMGMVVAGYGPMIEHLTRRFGVSTPVAGATISVYFAGSLPGVLIAMRLLQRLPARVVVTVAMAVAVVGLAGAAAAPAWPLYLAGITTVGLGFGALVIGLNQVVAYSLGQRRTALLNAVNGGYSAGAVAAPILVAAFAAGHFSLLYVAAAGAWLLLIPGAATISGRLPISAEPAARRGPLVAIFVAAFVLYVAVENGIGGWMTTHLVSTGLPFGRAAAVTSGFWLALVAGRILMFLVPQSISDVAIVLAGSSAGTAALLMASIGGLAPLAYVVAGLALAPIFPTGISWMARLSAGDSRATAWLFPAASIGGSLGPGTIGVVIAAAGVAWAPSVLALVALAMFAAFLVASRRFKPLTTQR